MRALRTETDALPSCPFCEGGGEVPTPSGMSDQPCLCVSLDYTRRLLADGRMEYAERCEASVPAMLARSDFAGAAALVTTAGGRVAQAQHLIYGCAYGPCTGNAEPGRCIVGEGATAKASA